MGSISATHYGFLVPTLCVHELALSQMITLNGGRRASWLVRYDAERRNEAYCSTSSNVQQGEPDSRQAVRRTGRPTTAPIIS